MRLDRSGRSSETRPELAEQGWYVDQVWRLILRGSCYSATWDDLRADGVRSDFRARPGADAATLCEVSGADSGRLSRRPPLWTCGPSPESRLSTSNTVCASRSALLGRHQITEKSTPAQQRPVDQRALAAPSPCEKRRHSGSHLPRRAAPGHRDLDLGIPHVESSMLGHVPSKPTGRAICSIRTCRSRSRFAQELAKVTLFDEESEIKAAAADGAARKEGPG